VGGSTSGVPPGSAERSLLLSHRRGLGTAPSVGFYGEAGSPSTTSEGAWRDIVNNPMQSKECRAAQTESMLMVHLVFPPYKFARITPARRGRDFAKVPRCGTPVRV